jgi:hypothetical protein
VDAAQEEPCQDKVVFKYRQSFVRPNIALLKSLISTNSFVVV